MRREIEGYILRKEASHRRTMVIGGQGWKVYLVRFFLSFQIDPAYDNDSESLTNYSGRVSIRNPYVR